MTNPLNWYFLYYYSYKLGAFILRLPEQNALFSSVMTAIQSGEDGMVIVGKMFEAGGCVVAAFLVGGLVMGTALPYHLILFSCAFSDP